jgi:hypothetical protein
MDTDILDIRDTPQFFADDAIVEAAEGLTRRIHPLVKANDGHPILTRERDWEGGDVRPLTVLPPGADGLWRMWYSSAGRKTAGPDLPHNLVHLAMSRDGVHWERPNLNLLQADGIRDNNILAYDDGTPCSGACRVFFEPDEPDPARRYKMMYYLPSYYLAFSADGLTWHRHSEQPVWPNGAGDGLEETNFFLRDERLGLYRGYMRVWRRHQTLRTLSLGHSQDLEHWDGPKIIWIAGPEFGPGAQIYGMAVHQEPGLYWGFPWISYSDLPHDPRWRQTIRLKLAWSREGQEWSALNPEQDVLPLGEEGAFDSNMILTQCPPVSHGGRLRLYYTGTATKHDRHAKTLDIGLAEGRPGGFLSLRAERDGVLLTRRLLMRGEAIRVNARTEPGGSVRAELLNDGGAILARFGADRSDPLAGDGQDRELTWGGSGDLSSIYGQSVYLRFYLQRADLFSFRLAGPPARFTAALGPAPVRCGRCAAPPALDGRLATPCWQDFERTGVAMEFVRFSEQVPAAVKTRVLVTRDDRFLYLGAECDEPLADRLPTGPALADNTLKYNREDTLEFRLNAPGQGEFFNQLMITPAGSRFHAYFRVEGGGSFLVAPIEWTAAVTRLPGRWCAELAVPFSCLRTPPPQPGETWRFNVIRHRHLDGKDTSCWSCMFGGIHRNDCSGTLAFA